MVFFAIQHALLPAFGLLLLLGAFGGFFIVPLNALPQERGKHTVGAGNAIAVQNLGENVAMLLMLGSTLCGEYSGIPVVGVGIGFGVVFARYRRPVDLGTAQIIFPVTFTGSMPVFTRTGA